MERGVPIRSVSRALTVLQVINSAGSVSLTEIARRAGLPYPTAARLVLTLLHEGMIEKEPDRKNYRPTAAVLSLASGFQDHSHLSVAARPKLVAFTRKHGWATVVSTRVGMNMIVRDCTHTLSPYTLATYFPGFIYPLIRSAAGRCYLAFCSPEDVAQVRNNPYEEPELNIEADAGGDAVDAFISDDALAEIRAKGYAVGGRNRFTVPVGKNSALATPIFQEGEICGVLSMIFLASAMRMSKAEALYAEELMTAAQEISADLEVTPLAGRLSA